MPDSPTDVILRWAASGGFAATHQANATDKAIAADLIQFIDAIGWELRPKTAQPDRTPAPFATPQPSATDEFGE